MRDAFINDIRQLTPADFVAKHLFDKHPHVFANRDEFVAWKTALAKGLEVDAAAISLVGSSATGISLNPVKNFKLFDSNSDIDVAVISAYHFQVAWRFFRNNFNLRHRLTPAQKASWDDHRTRLIYWGTIASDRLLSVLPFGPQWLPAILKATVGNREVKVRIYSDYEALRAYQIDSVNRVRNDLLNR